MTENSFFDRDLSWLSFNYRVMEEAGRASTPLLEKINFLSIYSSNLDEFYRVRVPALAALKSATLQKITEEVDRQLTHYGQLLTETILPELSRHDIEFIYQPAGQASIPYTLPVPTAVKNAATDFFFTELLAF